MRKKKRIYTRISLDILLFDGKQVIITEHALLRARKREIIFPDEIYTTIHTGKIKRFGKNHLRIQGKNIECVCEETNNQIIIKTVVRI